MDRLLLFVLIVVVLTGCTKSSNDPLRQLEGKMSVNGKQYTMVLSDYEQKEKALISVKHSSDLHEIAEIFDTLDVEKGAKITFEMDTNPSSITVAQMNEDGTTDLVEMKDKEMTIPSESGYYIYELKTIGSEGKQTFVFDVNVK